MQAIQEDGQEDVIHRNNVKVAGAGSTPMVFAHGFGCDQNMWRFVAPAFADRYKTVLFDHVGAGLSDSASFDPKKYESLEAYASDVIDICSLFDEPVIFVGHSVSAMIGALAALRAPKLFSHLIMVGPSPSYINDGDYVGGFDRANIEELLEFLDTNYLGWTSAMAPAIMGNADRPELASELENSFCRTDPEIAKHFARVTFLSDHRKELDQFDQLEVPSLILQCSQDVIAPEAVGQYMHSKLGASKLVVMKATGHCPNLSAPEETILEIERYLEPEFDGVGNHQKAA